MNLVPLDVIQRRSESNAFDIDKIDWSRGVDFTKRFFPDHLTPLFHTPVHGELSEEERLYYNQIYGCLVNEYFIFLEDRFLLQFLYGFKRLKTNPLSPALQEALTGFIEEEEKHTEMFRKLARMTAPERYAKGDFHFLRLGRLEGLVLDLFARRPDMFAFWAWLGVAFEEKTIDYFRHYRQHQKEHPDKPLDPLYTDVHHYHMLDEVRHVQIDHHLVRELYDQARPVMKKINVKVMQKMLGAYSRPRRAAMRLADELARKHPRLKPLLPRMKTELRALGREWQEVTYSRANVPQTFALFDEYPEMHALRDVLLCYEPEPVRDAIRAR